MEKLTFTAIDYNSLENKVIKPWFTSQRFNLTYVYFGYSTPLIQHLKEEVLDIKGRENQSSLLLHLKNIPMMEDINIGKDTKLRRIIRMPGMLGLWLLCVVVVSWYAFIMKA